MDYQARAAHGYRSVASGWSWADNTLLRSSHGYLSTLAEIGAAFYRYAIATMGRTRRAIATLGRTREGIETTGRTRRRLET